LSLLVAVFGWRYLRESRGTRASGMHLPPSDLTGRAAVARVLHHWREPASRLIWIYAVGIGAFYGTIQIVPLLLMQRFSVTEVNVGYFVMYLGAMGVVIRALILGRAVDWLGEAKLSRWGIVFLGAGLIATGLATSGPALALAFTLMPIGTAFLFPCVTGLLSRIVIPADRGLYMGVQHTFGGVSRVAFPVTAGLLMDHFAVGVPFWIAGLLVLGTMPLSGAMETRTPEPAEAVAARRISAADVTAELPVEP